MTIEDGQNWRRNIGPFGAPQAHSLARRALGEHKSTLDSNELQLLHHGEKPDRGELHGG